MIRDGFPPRCLPCFCAITILFLGAGSALSPSFAEASVEHRSHEWDRDDEADDTIEIRLDAGRKLE